MAGIDSILDRLEQVTGKNMFYTTVPEKDSGMPDAFVQTASGELMGLFLLPVMSQHKAAKNDSKPTHHKDVHVGECKRGTRGKERGMISHFGRKLSIPESVPDNCHMDKGMPGTTEGILKAAGIPITPSTIHALSSTLCAAAKDDRVGRVKRIVRTDACPYGRIMNVWYTGKQAQKQYSTKELVKAKILDSL